MNLEKEFIILGERGEVMSYDDFTMMGWDVQYVIEKVHIWARMELMCRDIMDVWDWSLRTRHMFENNNMTTIGHVAHIQLKQINNLPQCGFKTRREIYNIFFSELNIKLHQWNPDQIMDKYRFEGEIR